MNQTFSLNRFGRLLRTYFSDNRSSLLINIALLVGGLCVLSLFVYRNGYPDGVNEQRYILFFFIGWAAWYVFTVQQVAVLNEKERSISYLLRPASLLEKYLLIVLISGIGFLLIYLTTFVLIDAVGVSYVNHRHWTPNQLAQIRRVGGMLQIKSIFESNELRDVPTSIWVFTAFLHSTALALALFIRRYALPLIVVLVIGLIVAGIAVNGYILNGLLRDDDLYFRLPFDSLGVSFPENPNQYRRINPPQPIGNQLRYAVGIIAVVLLYVTAYFRLKEREV